MFLLCHPEFLSRSEVMHYARLAKNVDKMIELLIELGYNVKEDDTSLEMFCKIYENYESEGDDAVVKEQFKKVIMMFVKNGVDVKNMSKSFMDENFEG